MQVELLDRKKWNTRLELANAMFEYLEIWHNRRRRHSQLGWLSPIEFERNRIITGHDNPTNLDYVKPGTDQSLHQTRHATESRKRIRLRDRRMRPQTGQVHALVVRWVGEAD